MIAFVWSLGNTDVCNEAGSRLSIHVNLYYDSKKYHALLHILLVTGLVQHYKLTDSV